jgi:hypothetical protein
MNPIRVVYNTIPIEIRARLRSWLPGRLLHWYAHKNIDVYLISYPKCGRTWLRLMVGRAISRHFSLPENEDTLLLRGGWSHHPAIPRISIIHDDRPMLKAPEELEESKYRYRDKKVIFLARDPRDVVVSSYFEMKNRGNVFGNNPYEKRRAVFEGTLAEFIHRREGGFNTIIRYFNIWAANRQIPKDFLLVRYEDLKANTSGELRRVLDFLGFQSIPEEFITEAVNYASFDNMRRMESNGKFQTGILKPADKTDTESYKTRKGKVKGYFDYLSREEISNLDRIIQEQLSNYYGYAS